MTAPICCASCGNNHPTIGAYDHIENCSDRINRGEPLMLAQADDLVSIARCLHSQLYAANADLANARRENQELREKLNLGELLSVRTEYGVRRRDGEVDTEPGITLWSAVYRLDDMNQKAKSIGFDSAEAEVVTRDRGDYATDWAAVADADVSKARDEEPPF